METFQDLIFSLQQFWQQQHCVLLQPYHTEIGAGTLHPATVLRSLGKKPWRAAYVQPSIRPKDGRYGDNPNRLQHYYQFQVVLKPSPDDIQSLYLESLKAIGVDLSKHDVRFVEDDWENPTVGAWGLGWEVWCDGMEVSQFTYMQQVGGIDCRPVTGELTYGLERLAMYIMDKDNVYDLPWNKDGITYGHLFLEQERQFSAYNLEFAETHSLKIQFDGIENDCHALIEQGLPLPAYDQCLKASHILNLLDARGVIGVSERASFIARVRSMANAASEKWVEIIE